MDFFQAVIVPKAVFFLGITNLLAVTLLFISCRCTGNAKIISKLMKYKAYQRFYKYHCYIWRVLWPSLVIHMFLAIFYAGLPL